MFNKYDFQSKRVSKTVVNAGLTTTEFYVRDPQGNVLAIYADTLQNADRKFTLSELHLYGSSRLGTYKVDSVLWENGTTTTSSNKYIFKLGQKRYELSNHLGNVSTTISDRKLVDVQTNGIITAYKADVQSVTDYYPFGKTIAERSWSLSKQRYDFNGKETDQESGYQDYGFRDYDVEIARFLQVDPLHGKYPELSTYQFASNRPMDGTDLDGKEYYNATYTYQLQKDGSIKLINKDYVRVTTSEICYLSSGPYIEKHYHQTKPYGPNGMGVAFHLILQDVSGKKIHSQYDMQKREKATDYGVYSGETTIWQYKWQNGTFELDESDNKGYQGKADYNIPWIDPIDKGAYIHDKRYEAVGAAGPSGLLNDFATIEADMEAAQSWKTYGTPTALKQALFFDLIIWNKKSEVYNFMENSGQIKKGFWDPERKGYTRSVSVNEAYLAFRAKYMLKDNEGNWKRKPGMWTKDNKPK